MGFLKIPIKEHCVAFSPYKPSTSRLFFIAQLNCSKFSQDQKMAGFVKPPFFTHYPPQKKSKLPTVEERN